MYLLNEYIVPYVILSLLLILYSQNPSPQNLNKKAHVHLFNCLLFSLFKKVVVNQGYIWGKVRIDLILTREVCDKIPSGYHSLSHIGGASIGRAWEEEEVWETCKFPHPAHINQCINYQHFSCCCTEQGPLEHVRGPPGRIGHYRNIV